MFAVPSIITRCGKDLYNELYCSEDTEQYAMWCGWYKVYGSYIIPLFGIIIAKRPLHLTFVKENHLPEIIKILMCTELLSDGGKSNWPKPAEM